MGGGSLKKLMCFHPLVEQGHNGETFRGERTAFDVRRAHRNVEEEPETSYAHDERRSHVHRTGRILVK